MHLPHPSHRPSLAGLAVAALLLTGCAAETSVADEPRSAGPDGAVWVANEHGDSISVLDPRTGEVIATLTGIDAPHNAQASTTRDAIWVTGTGGVVAMDATDLFPTEAAPAGEHPAHVVETSDGAVFVVASGDDEVHEFDNTLAPRRTYDVGAGPHGMRVAPDGRLAAVADTSAGSVTLLQPGTNESRTVEVGPSPIQVGISHDSATVYVSVAGTNEVVRVDVESGKVTGRVAVPSAPAQLWVTSTGTVLSADQGSPEDPGNTLSIIDGLAMTVTATVEVGSGPHGITVDPEESRAWVTNMYDDTVSVVDLERETVVETVEVGDYPNGITYTSTTPKRPEFDPVRLILPHAFSHPEDSAAHSHAGDEAAEPADDEHEDESHGDH